MPQPLLALDFGGTKHAAALVFPGETTWHAQRRQLAPKQSDARSDLQVMRSLIHDLLPDGPPAAIGVSFGGPVEAATGTVRLSHHVPGWEGIPLQQWLTTEFGVPVQVDNDANVAAVGEHRLGAGRGYDSLLYVTVSTGVGGGWILNGQRWHGAGSMAGEIGHTVVNPAGPLCLCGKRGCVERLASGPYMVQQILEIWQQQPDRGPLLRQAVGEDLSQLTGQLISQAAAAGDELAQATLTQAGHALGVGIGNAANLINPQRFVLGGGVTKAGPLFWNAVQAAARATALPEVQFEIVPAVLGDEAPLWGAALLAADRLGLSWLPAQTT